MRRGRPDVPRRPGCPRSGRRVRARRARRASGMRREYRTTYARAMTRYRPGTAADSRDLLRPSSCAPSTTSDGARAVPRTPRLTSPAAWDIRRPLFDHLAATGDAWWFAEDEVDRRGDRVCAVDPPRRRPRADRVLRPARYAVRRRRARSCSLARSGRTGRATGPSWRRSIREPSHATCGPGSTLAWRSSVSAAVPRPVTVATDLEREPIDPGGTALRGARRDRPRDPRLPTRPRPCLARRSAVGLAVSTRRPRRRVWLSPVPSRRGAVRSRRSTRPTCRSCWPTARRPPWRPATTR